MQKWNVYTLDLWGNEKDGYEVNDRACVGSIELSEGADDQEIIQALLENDFLNSFTGLVKDKFEISGDDFSIYVDDKKNTPLFQLELI